MVNSTFRDSRLVQAVGSRRDRPSLFQARQPTSGSNTGVEPGSKDFALGRIPSGPRGVRGEERGSGHIRLKPPGTAFGVCSRARSESGVVGATTRSARGTRGRKGGGTPVLQSVFPWLRSPRVSFSVCGICGTWRCGDCCSRDSGGFSFLLT